MHQTKTKFALLALLVLCAMASGCRSKKAVVAGSQPRKPVAERSVECIRQQQPTFAAMQISKMTADIQVDGRTFSTGAACKLVTDSALILSVQPFFGVELFRVEMNATHVRIIDKMNRRYADVPFAQMEQQTGIALTFSDVQNLFCGRLFALGNPTYFDEIEQPWQLSKAANGYTVEFVQQGVQHLFRAATNCTLNSVRLIQENKATNVANVAYSNWQQTDGIAFPYQIDLSMTTGRHNGSCTLHLQRLSFGNVVDVQPANVGRYKAVPIDEILQK